MRHRSRTHRPRFVFLGGLIVLGASWLACRQAQFEDLFKEQIARPALECLHPMGELQTVGKVEVSDAHTFRGVMYWKGGFLGNNYVTKVEIRLDEQLATIYLLEDTAVFPALNRNCQFPIQR
jgi:hypothetical protein